MIEVDTDGNVKDVGQENQEAMLAMLNALTVATLRNYDATMALLSVRDYELYEQVVSKHERGELVGPQPFMSDNPWED